MSTLAYLHLPPGAPPATLPVAAPFKAVLVLETPADPVWRARVSTWLVDSGCLYAMTWGAGCEAWHDAIDDAFIAAHPAGLPDDDQLIMTTWHDDESLDEVADFAAHAAVHPSGDLADALVLHIADRPHEAAVLATFRTPRPAC
ncbi:hypothetical protein G5B46_07470 [Caulobacter sp. 602-2]|uniref:DUF7684 domain-containing protein n=1 Tax=Caulobacter sp. 602-2 TaxID=2710887 RepID=A0A6G4QUZ2_9CAUL|nr:hypothetical protein [Caulobacter sp. 602-2]NGM49440.1 hypothetical protein [Caulobacter sp. 602-2]